MFKIKKRNPRTRALITMGLSITILTLVFLFIFVKQQKQVLSNIIYNEQQNQKKMMTLLLEQTAQRYKSRIKTLITNRVKIIHSFAAKDRDKLLQLSSRFLEIFKKENPYFTSFFFTNPDNTIFLRAHKPELYGDDMKSLSPVILEGNQTRKIIAGFEIVKKGLQYRIVCPVFVNEEYIGLIGFGIDAHFFLNQLHPTSHTHLNINYQKGVDVALIFPKSELKKTAFIDKIHRAIGNYAIISDKKSYFQELPGQLDLEKKIQQIKLNGINYTILHTTCFEDFKGNKIAWGISLLNIEDLITGTTRTIVMTILFALGLLFFAFIILYFNFNALFKKITTLNDSLQQSNQKLEQRVKERTAELQESEQRFRMLFDEAPDAIFTFTLDDHIIDTNAAASRMLGYKYEEFQTMTVADLQAPEIRNKEGSVIRNELTRGKFFEGLDIHKNGTPVPIEVHNHKMNINGQDIVLSMVRDISKRKQAEDALKKSEAKLRAIFEANPDPVAVYDVKGYSLYLNPAFTEIFGWTLNELQGERIPFVPKDQQKITNKKIKEIYESGKPVRFETKRLTKHGKIINVLLSAAIIKDLQGANTGLVVNLADITEQKKIEGQLRQSQKMEAIGTLAGGIAHDFNNILSGILGFTQLAGMNLNDPVKAKKNLDQVTKGAQRAADLVQQILTFSRQVGHKNKPLKLFLIVKEVLKFLHSSIPATIEIQENISSRSMVLVDPTQVHQVVINLCTNAYHAMTDSGGTLSVALTDVEITSQNESMTNSCKPGNYIKLEISDTGHGMDKTTLARIFDPYFTTKDVGKGTGLGLAVVAGIVKKHNGFIKTYSKISHGSTFQVFWPIIEKNEFNNFSEKNKLNLLKGTEHIMLVDDETDILETSQELLKNQGYKVTTFKNGPSALQAFTKNPALFDLVITDMTMPQMTGDELSARILKLRKDIPVILCTGYHENFTEDQAHEAGISRYVQKPITNQKLSALIREILDEK